MSDRQITDHDVRTALESLIRGIRGRDDCFCPASANRTLAARGNQKKAC